MNLARAAVGALGALVLAGCVSRPVTMYSWGSYEEGIYASYSARSDYPVEKEITELEADYQEARSTNTRMPPGWHAHLGYLYYQTGKPEQARQEFMSEKAAYPESTVFMDRLLKNLSKAT
jgi:hypothetical protein